MKKLLTVLFCVVSLVTFNSAQAQDSSINIINPESHSVFKGLFISVWSKLKSFNPSQRQVATASQVYTAGIRGQSSGDGLLTPYWKGDLSKDKNFQAELSAFTQAQLKLDRGELGAAVSSLDDFLDQYGNSDLRPNALFAKAISLAGNGKTQDSLQVMQLFIDENPAHPLVSDANMVIQELSN